MARTHGEFLAGEVGEMAGVSGTTVGQWARRGLIRSSQSDGDPRRYSVEDVAEAAMVRALLQAGAKHREIHRAIDHLKGTWPLSDAPLAITEKGRIALRENGEVQILTPRGWQLVADPPRLKDVRLRLTRS